jgi:hypothetical protein
LNIRGKWGIYTCLRMMRLARSILLMVAWGFLVLPSCPCQVMSLFGIDLHGNESVTMAGNGRAVMLSRSRQSQGVPCHCDEEHAKSAILVDVEIDADGEDQPGAPVFAAPHHAWIRSIARTVGPASARPPPREWALPVPERAVFSVYRL